MHTDILLFQLVVIVPVNVRRNTKNRLLLISISSFISFYPATAAKGQRTMCGPFVWNEVQKENVVKLLLCTVLV